jgi:hypothetical protein
MYSLALEHGGEVVLLGELALHGIRRPALDRGAVTL